MAYIPSSGSVASWLQSDNASVITVTANQSVSGAVSVSNFPANQSVSGTVVASVTFPANQSVSGAVSVSNLPANQSVSGTVNLGLGTTTIGSIVLSGGVNAIGSVAALQGTNPWITANPAGSITAVAIVSGSVAVATGNSSVQLLRGTETIGSVAAYLQSAAASVITVNQSSSVIAVATGSVVALQLAGSIMAVSGVSVSISSVIVIGGSIISVPSGSVITKFQDSSLIGVVTGSVLALQSGTWRTSIASEYAANSASIVSGIGNLTLGVRNDTMSSTLANANGSYSPFAIGSWGDQIYSLAPSSTWTSGIGSTFTGVVQPIITSVAGMFLNVTGVQITNQSANNAYLTFYGTGIGSTLTSMIAYSAVPASGGSNILYPIPLRTAQSQPFQASVSGVASVYLSAQGFYSKV